MQIFVKGNLLPFLKELEFENFDLAIYVFYETENNIDEKINSLIDIMIGYKFMSREPSSRTKNLLSKFIIDNYTSFPEEYIFEKLLSILISKTIPELDITTKLSEIKEIHSLHSRLGVLNIGNNFNYTELMHNCCKHIYNCDFLNAINYLQILKCNSQFINSANKLDSLFFTQAFKHLKIIAKIKNDLRLQWELTILNNCIQ